MQTFVNFNEKHKKLALSVFLFAIVLLAGFVTTMSLFFDTQSSNQAIFSAGTLEMTVTGESGQRAEQMIIADFGESEVLSGSKTWTVSNVGSLNGHLELSVVNVRNFENGCTGPELLVDDTCGNPGEGEGELGKFIILDISINDNAGSAVVASSNLETDNSEEFLSQWRTNLSDYVLPASQSRNITITWRVLNDSYDNSIQSDAVEFDLIFDLKQIVQ